MIHLVGKEQTVSFERGHLIDRKGDLVDILEVSGDRTRTRLIATLKLTPDTILVIGHVPSLKEDYSRGVYVIKDGVRMCFENALWVLTDEDWAAVYQPKEDAALQGIWEALGSRFDSPPKDFRLVASLKLSEGTIVGDCRAQPDNAQRSSQ